MPSPSTLARLDSKLERRRLAHAWVWREKERLGCRRCPFKDPRALDFHHLDRRTKRYNISDMVLQGFTIQAIEEEIAKCELICRNCHGIEHGKRPSHSAGTKRRMELKRRHKRAPKLCLHKATGRGCATDPATGKSIYFGKWGESATQLAYERWAKHFLETHDRPKAALPRIRGSLASVERELFGRLYQIVVRLLKEEDRSIVTRQELAQAAVELEEFWQ